MRHPPPINWFKLFAQLLNIVHRSEVELSFKACIK